MVRRCAFEWRATAEDHDRHVCERPLDHGDELHVCAHCPEVTR